MDKVVTSFANFSDILVTRETSVKSDPKTLDMIYEDD